MVYELAIYNIKIPYESVPPEDKEFYESHGFQFDDQLRPVADIVEWKARGYKSFVKYLKSIPMSVFMPPDTVLIFPRKTVRLLWKADK